MENQRSGRNDQRVAQVLAEVERKFGVGALMRLGSVEAPAASVLPTGLPDLDRVLGGGWPRGRIVEVFGPEASGVSTLLLHAIAAAQKGGGISALIDLDVTFDPEYARAIGIDNSDCL